MPSNYVLGADAKLYTHATASTALASLELVTGVQDVTISMDKEIEDITTRGNSGWVAEAPTVKSLTLSFTMVFKPGDTKAAELRAAFVSNTTMAFAALTGASNADASEGPRFDGQVTKWERAEPVKGAIKVNVEVKCENFLAYEVISV